MKKILVGLSLLLLSNVVLASNYKVTVIFKEDGKSVAETVSTITTDINPYIVKTVDEKVLKSAYDTSQYSSGTIVQRIKSVEQSCIDNSEVQLCEEIIHTEEEENNISINLNVKEYNKLEVNFYSKTPLDKKEYNIQNFKTYKVSKIIDLKEQEAIISKLENKELKIIIEEIK